MKGLGNNWSTPDYHPFMLGIIIRITPDEQDYKKANKKKFKNMPENHLSLFIN
jgi:hypothetical protein